MAYITNSDLVTVGFDKDVLPPPASLTEICTRASLIADNFCHQNLGATATSEKSTIVNDPSGMSNRIFLSYTPIISVSHVYSYYAFKQYNAISSDDYELCDTYLEIDKKYTGKVEVGYTYGYSTIPADAKQAVILIASSLISDFITRKQTQYESLKSMQDGNLTLTFSDPNNLDDMPPIARKILMRYRRVN